MTSAPYRDQFAFVRQVEQHVGIALALLEQYEQLATDMLLEARETAEGVEVYERARRTWQDLWQQLEQARALAQGAGRLVVDRDEAFSAAAIWSVDGPMRRERDVALGNRRILKTVTFRSGDLVRSAVTFPRRGGARGGARRAANRRDPQELACSLVVGDRAVRGVRADRCLLAMKPGMLNDVIPIWTSSEREREPTGGLLVMVISSAMVMIVSVVELAAWHAGRRGWLDVGTDATIES